MLHDIKGQTGKIDSGQQHGKVGNEQSRCAVVRQPTHHDSHGVTTPHQWDETQHIGYLG